MNIGRLETALAKPSTQRAFLTGNQFKRLPQTGTIDPNKIRFSQNSIKSTFRRGGNIKELTEGLKDGTIDPSSIPPIRIVEKDGEVFTLDNRRLKAFQDTGVAVPFQKLDDIPENELDKFTTRNDGTSITIRN